MSPSFARLALALLPLTFAGGCHTTEADDPGSEEFRTTYACSTCGVGGTNSPAINDFEIPELELSGTANKDGVILKDISDPEGKRHDLQVINDEFAVQVSTPSSSGPGLQTLSGADLIGWKIRMSSPDGEYEVELADYDLIGTLANNGPAISAYGLKYESHLNPGEILSVCPDSQPDEAVVTLIGGETYDREHKAVVPGQTGWFTLACADEAVFKMKRMNYGPNADFKHTGAPATVEQRQATLKMITADYCGGGVSYTAQGTALLWDDTAASVGSPTPPANSGLESYWDENGALCLSTPRFASASEVAEECELPTCSTFSPYDPRIVWRTHTP